MWINAQGQIYAGDCVPGDRAASEQEIAAARPNPALAQIVAIELSITPRRMREAALTDAGKQCLLACDAEIAALRNIL